MLPLLTLLCITAPVQLSHLHMVDGMVLLGEMVFVHLVFCRAVF